MSRLMSFFHTEEQFLSRDKDVTRRLGWRFAKPGQICTGVEKAWGLKRGEKAVRMGDIRIVEVSREPLRRLIDEPEYGEIEVIREGFPKLTPIQFVALFCDIGKCQPETEVTRIEYVYIEDGVCVPVNSDLEQYLYCYDFIECPICHRFEKIREGYDEGDVIVIGDGYQAAKFGDFFFDPIDVPPGYYRTRGSPSFSSDVELYLNIDNIEFLRDLPPDVDPIPPLFDDGIPQPCLKCRDEILSATARGPDRETKSNAAPNMLVLTD